MESIDAVILKVRDVVDKGIRCAATWEAKDALEHAAALAALPPADQNMWLVAKKWMSACRKLDEGAGTQVMFIQQFSSTVDRKHERENGGLCTLDKLPPVAHGGRAKLSINTQVDGVPRERQGAP